MTPPCGVSAEEPSTWEIEGVGWRGVTGSDSGTFSLASELVVSLYKREMGLRWQQRTITSLWDTRTQSSEEGSADHENTLQQREYGCDSRHFLRWFYRPLDLVLNIP